MPIMSLRIEEIAYRITRNITMIGSRLAAHTYGSVVDHPSLCAWARALQVAVMFWTAHPRPPRAVRRDVVCRSRRRCTSRKRGRCGPGVVRRNARTGPVGGR
jgi:hypothetical protein